MNDQITIASFTLVPGVILCLIGFIGIVKTAWDDLNRIYYDYPVGFSGWFWQTFKWMFIIFFLGGILLILTFYAFVTE